MLLAITWTGQDCVSKSSDPAHHHIIDGTSVARIGPVPMAAHTRFITHIARHHSCRITTPIR